MGGEAPLYDRPVPERPVTDRLRRPLRDLRISVTDRCNFRCPYCMPEKTYHGNFRFLGTDEQLGFDEIERVARAAATLGVTKLRLTGGEPLLRPGLPDLVARLARVPGIDDIALTTNGARLARHLPALRAAGLSRVTVSLDSVEPAVFAAMSGGREELASVLEGIEAARATPLDGPVKVNAVIRRGVNDSGVPDLLARFRFTGVVVRLIEYMDVGNRNGWRPEDVVPSRELLERIGALWPLAPLSPNYDGEVARRYRYADGGGEIGFISSVSAPFCGGCSRARLSADGKLHTCLFAAEGTDLRTVLRSGAGDDALREALRAVWRKRADRYSEERGARAVAGPARPARGKIEMHYIGG